MEKSGETTFELIELVAKDIKDFAGKSIYDLGLTAQQGKVIKYIYMNEKKNLIQKELAEQFNRSTASMGSMLKILEREGYIKRFFPPDNNRQKQITLLPKGKRIVEEYDKRMINLKQDLFTMLPEKEFSQLSLLLTKLHDKMGENE